MRITSRRWGPIDRFTLPLALPPIMALLAVLLLVPRTAQAGGVVGSGTPLSCTEVALNAALAGGGAVTFNCGASPYTITVSSNKVISADTTVDGDGLITLSGGNATRVFSVTAGVSLVLANLTISGGWPVSGHGGGVFNSGSLTVISSTFSNNGFFGFLDGRGGGIYNSGMLTITNSAFSSNSAQNPSDGRGGGGAIYSSGTLTVISTTFDSNGFKEAYYSAADHGGGAIYNAGVLSMIGGTFSSNYTTSSIDSDMSHGGSLYNSGTMSISSSTFISNTAKRDGGGIYNGPTGQAVVADTALIGNSNPDWGGGLYNAGALTVTNGTIQGNSASTGGGIYNSISGTLSIVSGTVANNFTTSGFGEGGGLVNNGIATIISGTFTGNASGANGAGINNAGTLILSGSTASENQGSGVYNNGRASITNSAIYSNTQSGIENAKTLTVTNTSITGNSTSGDGGGIFGIMFTGSVKIDNSIIARNGAGNYGGGIYVVGGAGYKPPILITGSSIYSNTASQGGAFFGATMVTISNSAIYSNTTDGINNDGPTQVTNSTVSGNSGIGVSGSPVTLDYDTIVNNGVGIGYSGSIGNSILTQNQSSNCSTGFGWISSNDYNVLGAVMDCSFFEAAHDQIGADPLIGPLQDNGGASWTRALQPGSPAIDAANPESCLAVDQIDTPRPQPAGGLCDIGAYEVPVRKFQFSAPAYSVKENAGQAVITLTHGTAPLMSPLTVTIRSSDNTATAGSDYAAISRTLTFPPGVTTLTTTVSITDDVLIENDESLMLTLSSPIGIQLGEPYSATLTILDDEPRLQFSSSAYSVRENLGPATITVTLSPISAQPVTVDFKTTDGTASSLTDYVAVSRTLTFDPGVAFVTVTIPISDDVLSEANETISLTLSSQNGASLGLSSAVLAIMDDEPVTAIVNVAGDAQDANPGDGICDSDLASAGPQCTLRAAIEEANLRSGTDSITFDISGTIALTRSLPVVGESVNIVGPGAGILTVDAQGLGRQLTFYSPATGQSSTASGLTLLGGAGDYDLPVPGYSSGGGAVYVGANTDVVLSSVIITGGYSSGGYGGGIWNNGGALTLTNSLLANNVGSYGGGLFVFSGTVTISDTAVTGNTGAYSGGGGIANLGGILTIANSSISGNHTTSSMGGGLTNGYVATVINSDIYSNTSSSDGGGMANTGNLTLSNTLVMSNTANGTGGGGGIYNQGTLTLGTSLLRHNIGNRGGGLTNSGAGKATVDRSSIYSNTSYLDGGGVANYATLTMTNVTIGNNYTLFANGDGGGLYNTGTLLLDGVTMAGNVAGASTGGGIRAASGSVTLHNTLIANNAAIGSGPDVNGTISSLGYNLIGRSDGSSGWVGTDLTGTVAVPLDAKLGSFDGQVYPVLGGSPAIDAGDPVGCLPTDQLGVVRPIDGDGDGLAKCDIGAFEYVEVSTPTPTPTASPTGTSTRTATATATATASATAAPTLDNKLYLPVVIRGYSGGW